MHLREKFAKFLVQFDSRRFTADYASPQTIDHFNNLLILRVDFGEELIVPGLCRLLLIRYIAVRLSYHALSDACLLALNLVLCEDLLGSFFKPAQ